MELRLHHYCTLDWLRSEFAPAEPIQFLYLFPSRSRSLSLKLELELGRSRPRRASRGLIR